MDIYKHKTYQYPSEKHHCNQPVLANFQANYSLELMVQFNSLIKFA